MKCCECKYLDCNDYWDGKYRCTRYNTYEWADNDSDCQSFWEDRYRSQSEIDNLSGRSSDSCFITMSCKHTMNIFFSDNCGELECLRKARDTLKEVYPQDIKEYYEKSPKVVAVINSLFNCSDIYKEIYIRLTLPLTKLIKNNRLDAAYILYKKKSFEIFAKYIG